MHSKKRRKFYKKDMLDLKLLEKQLDDVLAKETPETMSFWLFNRRLKKYISSFGEGNFVCMPTNKGFVSQSKEVRVDNKIKKFSTEYVCMDESELITAA